jgi:hypothetical protein
MMRFNIATVRVVSGYIEGERFDWVDPSPSLSEG